MPSVARAPHQRTDPDPRQQAPFEVGDQVTSAGHARARRQRRRRTTSPPTPSRPTSASTRKPGTQPSYLAIGEFGVGTADPSATAVNGAAQETQDRIFLESETTDVKTPVDIYMQDVTGRRRP